MFKTLIRVACSYERRTSIGAEAFTDYFMKFET